MENTTTLYNEAIDKIIATIPNEPDMYNVFFAITKMKEMADQHIIESYVENAHGKMLADHQYAFMHITRIFEAFTAFHYAMLLKTPKQKNQHLWLKTPYQSSLAMKNFCRKMSS